MSQTVDGVEYPSFPKILEPKGTEDDYLVVGDFSSTILSRRIPIKVRLPALPVNILWTVLISQRTSPSSSLERRCPHFPPVDRISPEQSEESRLRWCDRRYHSQRPPPSYSSVHLPDTPSQAGPAHHADGSRLRHHREEQQLVQHSAYFRVSGGIRLCRRQKANGLVFSLLAKY